jgi:hypothetical protein
VVLVVQAVVVLVVQLAGELLELQILAVAVVVLAIPLTQAEMAVQVLSLSSLQIQKQLQSVVA